MTPTARLVALLDHLGVGRAHVASQIPSDMAGLAAAHPGRLGGIVCVTPVRLDPVPFTLVAGRMLLVAGEYGPTFETTTRAASRLPGAQHFILDGYEAHEMFAGIYKRFDQYGVYQEESPHARTAGRAPRRLGDIESVAATLRFGSKAGEHVDPRYFRPAPRNAWNAAWASGDLRAALKACISAAI